MEQLVVHIKRLTPDGRLEPVAVVLDPATVRAVMRVVLDRLQQEGVQHESVTIRIDRRTDD